MNTGIWEDADGTLVVRFGAPFAGHVPHGLPRREQDRLLREQLMTAIGRLLPREYWGVYEAAIQRSRQELAV